MGNDCKRDCGDEQAILFEVIYAKVGSAGVPWGYWRLAGLKNCILDEYMIV